MQLSDHDLKQLDDTYLGGLPIESLRGLSSKLLADLKESRERLNQNPSNSSRPPSSQAPWENTGEISQESAEDAEDVPQEARSERSGGGKKDAEAEAQKGHEEGKSKQKTADRGQPSQGRPGRAEGAPGYSRTQKLPVDKECVHLLRCAPTDTIRCKIPGMKAPGKMRCPVPFRARPIANGNGTQWQDQKGPVNEKRGSPRSRFDALSTP